MLSNFRVQLKDLNIEIRFNTEITSPEQLSGFDKVIIATGAKPVTLHINGFETFCF